MRKNLLKSLVAGAAILAPELAARFERLFGLHIHESLGMTEMAGISTITPPGVNAPAGCVGWRLPYTQLRVVALDAQGNASDQDLPPGQPGMVLFQSPNLFSGFLDAADTAKAFAEQYGVTYPSLIDVNTGEAKLAFARVAPTLAPPTTLVLDKDGRVAARIIGQLESPSILSTIVGDLLEESA